MDFETKYYRPNLAKGTAGAAKTTPTPIRRSAAKWAMPVDDGGSYPVIDLKVSGTGADAINAALAQYLPLEQYPHGEAPRAIGIALENVGIGGTYSVTGTPGADWLLMVGDVEPTGKGEPVTASVLAQNKRIQVTIMAATKEDGTDIIMWTITIEGGK